MEINQAIGEYTDEQIVSVVRKMIQLLDESIDGNNPVEVRNYMSRLSAYRGMLITIEFQLKRNLIDREEIALENNIMSASSREMRDLQLQTYTKTEKDNYETIKTLREELTSKSTLASSILKSINNRGM